MSPVWDSVQKVHGTINIHMGCIQPGSWNGEPSKMDGPPSHFGFCLYFISQDRIHECLLSVRDIVISNWLRSTIFEEFIELWSWKGPFRLPLLSSVWCLWVCHDTRWCVWWSSHASSLELRANPGLSTLCCGRKCFRTAQEAKTLPQMLLPWGKRS